MHQGFDGDGGDAAVRLRSTVSQQRIVAARVALFAAVRHCFLICAAPLVALQRTHTRWRCRSDDETLGSHHKSNRVLLETKVEAAYSVSSERRKWCSRTIRVPLDAELLVDGAILQVELWAAEASQSADTPDGDGDDAFLSLVGVACVDPKRWREAADCTAKRWYPLQPTRAMTPEVEGDAESAFEELEERLRADTTYVRATLVGMASKKKTREKETEGAQEGAAAAAASEASRSKLASLSSPVLASPTTEEDNFRFTLPSQLVTKNRRFLMTRVGEILFEVRTPSCGVCVLVKCADVVAVALSGRHGATPRAASCCSLWQSPVLFLHVRLRCEEAATWGSAVFGQESAAVAALLPVRVLLRQQARGQRQVGRSSRHQCDICTHHLCSIAHSAIEAAREKLVQRMLQLQAARRQMVLRRRNLRRELQVLDSSLDGMQMLLQEVDPDCHEHLLPGDAVQR